METTLQNRGMRLFQGSVLRTISTFLKIIIGFFMLPFLIHNLGDKTYGLWVLVMSFMSYYTLLRMGLSGAVARYLSQAVGKKKEHEMSLIASTSFFIYLGISIIMILVTLLLIFFGTSLFGNIGQYNASLFKILILILGLNTALAPPFSVFGAVLVSHLKYNVGEIINIVHLIILNASIILFISLGKGLIYIALSYFISNTARSIFIYFYIKKKHKEVTIKFSLFDKNKFKILFSFSFYSFISQLAETLRFKLDTVIITIFIGLAAITHYTVASSVILYFTLFITSTIGVFGGYVSQEEGRGDFNSIRDKFTFINKLNTYICVFVGISIIIYGKVFIQRWMGIDYINSYTLLVILTIPSIIYLSQFTSATVMYGLSKNKFLALTNFIEGLLNVIISIILIKKYGLIGVALGTAIPMFVIKFFIQPIYINKILKMKLGNYYIKFFKNLALPTLILGIYFLIVRKFVTPSYFILIVLVAVQILFFLFAIYYIGFNKEKRKLLLSFISKSA